MTITSYQISDVNECVQAINKCSRNGYCINAQGTYRSELFSLSFQMLPSIVGFACSSH